MTRLFLILIPSLIAFINPSYASNNNGYSQVGENDDYVSYKDNTWSDPFDWKLMKAFSLKDYKNVILSPLSLKLVLAILYEGSSGKTRQEFQRELLFSSNDTENRLKFSSVIKALQGDREEYVFNLGTRVFLDASINPQQKYASIAKDYYQTDIARTNFSDPIDASNIINSWIETTTNGRIKKMVKPENIEDSVLLVANAMFFKGLWRLQFPKNQTHVGSFYVSPTDVLQNVQFMSNKDKYFYAESEDLDAQIVRIPYRGQKFALFIIKPNAKAGLDELLNTLSLDKMRTLVNSMSEAQVELIIPKFKFDFQARLADFLKGLGLQSMFQNTGSFAGIARGMSGSKIKSLFVSDVLQKAGIEINEEGSVVYAATEITLGNKFKDVEATFNLTNPFLFFIEEQTTQNILFVGKVENPLQSESIPLLPNRFSDSQNNNNNNNIVNTGSLATTSSDQEIQQRPVPTNQNQNQNNQNYGGVSSFDPQPEIAHESTYLRFNNFDIDLFQAILGNSPGENFFVSPASVKSSLLLILEGAVGKTGEEIANWLRIPRDLRFVRDLLSKFLINLEDPTKNAIVESVNGIYVSQEESVKKKFQQILETHYKAFIKQVDFTNEQKTLNEINGLVASTTKGKIPQLLSPGALGPEIRMMVVNALYFKGLWKTMFENTTPGCFTSPKKSCINVEFMHVEETYNYKFFNELDSHVVELPYTGDTFSMLLVIPNQKNGMETLTKDISHIRFRNLLDSLEPTEIMLGLPKFEMEYSTDLIPALQKIGISQLFTPEANISGILDHSNAFLSKFIHKTKVEVTEKGTEAAAASGAVFIPLMGSSKPRIFADHPFAFFICHKPTKTILFEGALIEPSEFTNNAQQQQQKNIYPPTQTNRGHRMVLNYPY